MNTPIKLKSSSNGLRVVMEPECTIEELEIELRSKLEDCRKFFGSAKMVISFEGKEITEKEQDYFCDIISECTDIDIICVTDLTGAEEEFNYCLRVVSEEFKRNDVCFIRGSVIDQAFIDSEKDVIVIGDVHPGCTIVSRKSIYIFGGLYGEAYAGILDEDLDITDSPELIMAMEMAPEELRIGSLSYEPAKKSKWGIKPKLLPQIAYASNDKINIEPYTKELLKRVME